jgi:hypothetical protein
LSSEHVLTVTAAEQAMKGKRLPQPSRHAVGYCIPCKAFVAEGDWLCAHLREVLDAGPSHMVARLDDRAVLESVSC